MRSRNTFRTILGGALKKHMSSPVVVIRTTGHDGKNTSRYHWVQKPLATCVVQPSFCYFSATKRLYPSISFRKVDRHPKKIQSPRGPDRYALHQQTRGSGDMPPSKAVSFLVFFGGVSKYKYALSSISTDCAPARQQGFHEDV